MKKNDLPPLPETGMSIAMESNDELQQLRTRLRKMSDDELVRFGKAARSCAGIEIAPTRSSGGWKRPKLSGAGDTRPSPPVDSP